MAAATRFDEYQVIVSRVRQAVESVVPAGSTVLVASKGDPALLNFDQRTGWHFPRATDGQYAGFHPADSNDAIARLDHQRGLGARYLVIPVTSAWWLEHYPELFAHVSAHGRPLLEDSTTAWIFELAPRPVVVSTPKRDVAGPSPATRQLIDLLQALLPEGATVALVTSTESDLLANSPLPAFAFRYTDDPFVDPETTINDLRDIADGGAEFLVLPASSRDWLDAQKRVSAHIEDSYALVADQRNVCRIYDLRLRPGDGG
jgi:hypothetical protein